MSSNLITALDGIKTILGSPSHLNDPYPNSDYEPTRNWVHEDVPLATAKYPRIQVRKINSTITKISYGHKNYCDKEDGVFGIYFYTIKGFQYPYQGTTNYYKDERLVEYYLGSIKECLKKASAQAYMEDRNIHGFVAGDTSNIIYNPETKVYVGAITVKYNWYTL